MMSWRMTAGQVANRAPFVEKDANRLVVLWLLVMAALVDIMVVIGGITRLTGSGLARALSRPLIGT